MSVKSQSDRPKEGCHHATRFRVFRFILDFAGSSTIWPSVREVAESLDIDPRSAAHHMRALEGAAGLPKVKRRGRRGIRQDRFWSGMGMQWVHSRDMDRDPYCSPVDKLIA